MSTGAVTDPAVHIGAAAALYQLAPSALRWWEECGLLGPPERDGTRRRYRETDLRRVGMAYLCSVTGMMPLAEAAVVVSGKARNAEWQRAVTAQIEALGDRIEQLTAARDYLSHLLGCPDDDMINCPYLDRELAAHTPRGRLPQPDLLSAARAALGDEKPVPCDETRCPTCAQPLAPTTRGRPRRYCSPACRQRAYRDRRQAG